MDTVQLGNTGIHVSRLSFGTGTNGWNGRSNQTDLGLQKLSDLLRYAFDRGVTFWDSADQYGSHPHVTAALADVRRQDVVLATKTCARTAAEAEADLDRYLLELRTDYLDIVLIHCISSHRWPETYTDVMEVLEKKKRAGVLRAHGVSSHDFGALTRAAETSWVDVVLARINHAGKNMDATPEKVIPVLQDMHDGGIGTYGMKVFAAGGLISEAERAIRFVLDQPSVDAITIGMTNREQVDDNVGWVESHRRVLQPA